jgi:iron complex outermembrane receptor protein
MRGLRTALEGTQAAVGVTGGILPGTVPRYGLRGFTDNNLTLLRDGIRQNTMAQSSRPVDAFSLDRIEVLKGPASVLYGEGAIAGVIHYVSRQPSTAPRTELRASYGSWDDVHLGLHLTRPALDGKLATHATVSHRDNGGYAERNRARQTSLSAGAAWQVAPALKTALAADFSREDTASYFGAPVIYDAVDRRDPVTGAVTRVVGVANIATDRLIGARLDPALRRRNFNLPDSYTEADNFFLRSETSARVSPALELRLTAFHSRHFVDWRNSENYVWNPATRLIQRDLFFIYRDDTINGARADALWETAPAAGQRLRLVGGLDATWSDYTRKTRGAGALAPVVFNIDPFAATLALGETPAVFARPVPQADATIDVVAPFVEAFWQPRPALKFIAGLRRDTIDFSRVGYSGTAPFPVNDRAARDYRSLNARAGVVLDVAPQTALYAAFTEAQDPVLQFVSLGSADTTFGLQDGRQWELGVKHTALSGRLDLTLALYDILKNNLRTSQIINGVRVGQLVGSQKSRGAELALSYVPARAWRFEAGAAYTDAAFGTFTENQGANGIFDRTGNTPPNVPRWVVNAFASYATARGTVLTAGGRHVGARFANNANLIELPGYTALDAAVSHPLTGRVTATLRVRNLTDRLYADWAINNGLQQRTAEPRSFELTLATTF